MLYGASIFKDVAAQAFHALSDNLLRTLLSIIGISIGIAAVMTVGTISQGIRSYIFTELETYGLKTVWVYRDWGDDEPNRSIRQGSGINAEDVAVIKAGCCSAIRRATAVVYSEKRTVSVHVGSNYYDAPVEGVDIEYLAINNDHILHGRNLREEDIERRKTVAVVGQKLVKALFGENTDGLGQSFRFFNQKVTIVGVLKDKSRDLLAQIGWDDYDINGRVLIPYTLYQSMMGVKDVYTLQAEAVSIKDTKTAIKQITELLQRRHADRFKYTTESMEGWINTANSVLMSISLVGLGGASLALLVGGIGIMNIMSTSVIERTREIGIRKALGARNNDILSQFLMEAAFVSALGGFIGVLIGVIVAKIISAVSGYPLDPSWSMALIALIVSIGVGVLSGFYPARRAASLKPVDALRYE